MTATIEQTDIDARTRDELAPSCEVLTAVLFLGAFFTQELDKCDARAEWVVHANCACGNPQQLLMCTEHKEEVERGEFVASCGAFVFVSAEPLT